jgi:hypothetical protein
VLTVSEVHQRIEACVGRMDGLLEEVTTAAGDAAVAESTFKAEFAKARLKARAEAAGRKITTDEAEDVATVATEDERRGYLFATNNLTVLREALRACQSQMDGLRTMAASHRQAGG